MLRIAMILPVAVFSLPSNPVALDERLSSRLDLSMDQVRRVEQIQADARRPFASVRQEFNRESRALRRARIANDSAELARLEAVTETLRARLLAMRQAEDQAIRALLNPLQQRGFDAFLVARRQMHGSSRDERLVD